MTYEAALEKIHSLLPFGSRPGLDRMRELLHRLGDPQDSLRFIHVAGTNGKGSVCAVLSAILREAGYRTGLFISPYITDFRERIQIDNVPVSKETLTAAVEATCPVLEQLREEGVIITEFEYVNALEFYIHAQAHCDIVVLETGMGGLLDCTNVIRPPLGAVITTIGLDHTAVLGDTVEAIAAQKCGIIKNGSAAFTSRQCPEAMAVIEETAARLNVPLVKSESLPVDIDSMALTGSRFSVGSLDCTLHLAGRHQIENALTALSAVFYFRTHKLLSVRHNPNGIAALRDAVSLFLPDTPITCVLGMLADKDVGSAVGLLRGAFRRVYTVPVCNPRAMAAKDLAEICRAADMDAAPFDSPLAAIEQAVNAAEKEHGAVLICGSLYLAGEVRPALLKKFGHPTE